MFIPLWVVLSTTLIALLVLIISLWFYRVRRKARSFVLSEKPVPPPIDEEPDESQHNEQALNEKTAKHRAMPFWVSSQLCKYHFIADFKSLLKILRIHVSGRDYRYDIPWVLLIGDENSGKSTLLEHIQMDKPFGSPAPSEAGCEAWLFDRGVILDLAGRHVASKESGHHAPCWQRFLKTLRSVRPRKPLEAIVLTLNAQELIETFDAPDIAQEKAENLYKKLWAIQKELGMRLPVYVLITHCDKLEGFTAFSEALPSRLHSTILGWSNPDSLHTAYNQNYTARAFSEIYRHINTMQLELIASPGQIKDTESLLSFSHNLRNLFNSLQPTLDKIFRPSIYQESFFLRGIYCSGALNIQHKASSGLSSDATSSELEFAPGVSGHIQDIKVIYLTHLFREKIFRETGVARPVTLSMLQQMRRLWGFQAAFVAALVIVVGGQWFAYSNLNYEKNSVILPIFDDIRQDIQELEVARVQLRESPAHFANLQQVRSDSARRLVSSLGAMRTEHFGSVFLPLSWFSPIDEDIMRALASAYDIFILQWIRNGLDARINAILYKGTHAPDRQNYAILTDVPEYQLLMQSMSDLREFATFVNKYNQLADQSAENNMRSIEELAFYTHGLRVTSNAQPNAYSLSGRALGQIQDFRPFRLAAYQEEVQGQIEHLTELWLDNFFKNNNLLLLAQQITQDLDALRQAGTHDEQIIARLVRYEKRLHEIKRYLESPDWQWLVHDSVLYIPAFQQFMAQVVATPLLGEQFSNDLLAKSNRKYQQFRNKLLHMQSLAGGAIIQLTTVSPELTKPSVIGGDASETLQDLRTQAQEAQDMLSSIQGQSLNLNAAQVQIYEQLTSFMQEDFMQQLPHGTMRRHVPDNMLLYWDVNTLHKAITLVSSYQSFRSDKEPQILPELRATVRQTGQVRLRHNLQSLLHRSQHFKPATLAHHPRHYEEVLREQIDNYKHSSPVIVELLERLTQLSGYTEEVSVLQEYLITQGIELLARIDRLLQRENLYMPEASIFAAWDGYTPISQGAFGVASLEELEYYLMGQRERVKFIVERYAQPVIEILDTQGNFLFSSRHLLPRWENIIQNITSYHRSELDNSLAKLERFILFELDKITHDNCFAQLDDMNRNLAGMDYFIQRQLLLQERLFDRCLNFAKQQGLNRYTSLQRLFANTLSGNFPFTDKIDLPGRMPSVRIDDLRKFFEHFARYQDNLDQMLAHTKSFGHNHEEGIRFIHTMRDVEAFFNEFLQAKVVDAIPEYKINVEFRVNRDFEVGANQIIDWTLEINSVPLQNNGGVWQGIWHHGDAITLKMRWARNSRFRPYWDGETHINHLRIENEDTVVLDYPGQWGLLEFIASHPTQLNDYSRGTNRDNSLLKLRIPVVRLLSAVTEDTLQKDSASTKETPGSVVTRSAQGKRIMLYQDQYREFFEQPEEAIVYMRVRLYEIESEKQVVFPVFPIQAPQLEKDDTIRPAMDSNTTSMRE